MCQKSINFYKGVHARDAWSKSLLPVKDTMKKMFQQISYCDRHIHVYDSSNEDKLQNASDIIWDKFDPTYDSANTTWNDINNNNEELVNFWKHILEK